MHPELMRELLFNQRAGRSVLKCTDGILGERFNPFFAHAHKGSQRIVWPENKTLAPSSGLIQGDINSSKLFTFNTALIVQDLQDAGGEHVTVVAIVDDITIMGTLSALVTPG